MVQISQQLFLARSKVSKETIYVLTRQYLFQLVSNGYPVNSCWVNNDTDIPAAFLLGPK